MAWGTPTDAEIAALIGTRIPDCLFCAPARDDAQHPETKFSTLSAPVLLCPHLQKFLKSALHFRSIPASVESCSEFNACRRLLAALT
jgi:hypothetical protein